MKKIISLSLLTLLGVFILIGCSNSKNNNLSFTDAYSYSAIGGIGLLNQTNEDAYNTSVDSKNNKLLLNNKTQIKDELKNTILKNLSIAYSTIRGEVVKSETKESDRLEYQYYYTISTVDINGNNQLYEFYYNITSKNIEEDDFEVEIEEKLEGIVILNDVEYKMIGEKEKEDNEEESNFKIFLDQNNFVEIEQESSNNEQEFEYIQHQNGKVVYKTTVEYERKFNKNIELKFEVFEKNIRNKYKYEFFNKNNKSYVSVNYINDQNKEKILIEIVLDMNNNPSFVFVEE